MPNISYELSSSVERDEQEHHHQVDFAEDILFEIFVRLPLKSICKFRCVSKSCLSLFSNPSFINWFFNNFLVKSCGGSIPWTLVNQYGFDWMDYSFDETIHNPSLFLTLSTQLHHKLITSNHPGFSFEFVLDSYVPRQEKFAGDIFPLASSNGLVLCSSNESGPRDYLICNPFTRQIVSLPLPTPSIRTKGFNGFYYESSTRIYKVIHIPDSCVSRSFNLQSFSSDTNEWTTHEVSCSQEMHINNYLPRTACYNRFRATSHLYIVNHSNGIWYWIDGRGDRIIAYNHNHNSGGGSGGECMLFDLPEGSIRVNFEQQCLGEAKGHLYYGKIEKVGDVSTISVWRLQDGYYTKGSTWELVCKNTKIEDDKYVTPLLRKDIEYAFIAFNPVDPNVLIMERHNGHPVDAYEVAYNIKTRKCERLRPSHLREECYYFKADARIVVTLQPTIIPTITS